MWALFTGAPINSLAVPTVITVCRPSGLASAQRQLTGDTGRASAPTLPLATGEVRSSNLHLATSTSTTPGSGSHQPPRAATKLQHSAITGARHEARTFTFIISFYTQYFIGQSLKANKTVFFYSAKPLLDCTFDLIPDLVVWDRYK